jgi:hypothetical protein
MLNLPVILGLVQALAPLVVGGVVGVQHVIATIEAVRPELEVDDDLRALIAEAIVAKADADRAAAGLDPQ